jgi:hypothetical protein
MAGLDYRGKGLGLAPNEYCTLDRIRQKSLQMETRMSDELLIENIKALLHLNVSNSLVPHGIGNHARDLLDASITSIDRLRAEVASLKSDLESYMRIANDEANENVSLTQQLAAANGRVEMLAGWLRKYGNHYRGPGEMCELLKHSDYPCTCGLDAALSNLNEDRAG